MNTASERSREGEEEADEQEKKPRRKPSFLMRKLKLRGRRSSAVDSTEALADEKERRTTPEGEKSVSDTDLTEGAWKSVEHLAKDNLKVSIESSSSSKVVHERTKSLEDLKSAMPAYGELVLDPNTIAVTHI